jgi:hypothetical protein
VKAAVDAGAELCVVDDEGLTAWLPLLNTRTQIAAAHSLLVDVLVFVDRDRVFRLRAGKAA